MNWYDLIAPLYDGALRKLYYPCRQKAVQAMDLGRGLAVLDLGCGTGLNFELILDSIGVEGVLIGVDYSAKMLAQTQEKVDRQGWDQVRLLKRDARQLDRSELDEIVDGDIEIHRMLCTLGLSVFPE